MRGFYTEEGGVSPVVAVLLLMSIFIGVYAIYMTVTIPGEFASKEKEHMSKVRDSFLRLQSAVQEMSAGESRSVSVPMSANLVSGTVRGPGIGGRLVTAETLLISGNTVALWLMDEGSGTTVNDETKKNNGTIYGATWANGRYNKGLMFDNLDDNVEVLDSDSLDVLTNKLTIEAWVYHMSRPAGADPDWWDVVITKGEESSNGCYRLAINNWGNVQFRIKDSTGTDRSVGSSGTLDLNTWYHIAGTYDGNEMRLYINGVPDGTTTAAFSIGSNVQNLYIGMNLTAPGWEQYQYHFHGVVDEARIENRVLSDSEIAERAKRGTLYYEIQNAYYSPQIYVYEHGAVILFQPSENKSLMISPPTMIDVTPYGAGDNVKVRLQTVQLMGSGEVTGTGTETLTVSVENLWQTPAPSQPNVENVTVVIHSDYRDAWKSYLLWLADNYLSGMNIHAAVDFQNLQLTLYGKDPTSGVNDIYLVKEYREIDTSLF